MTDHEHEPDWSVILRRQPASLSTGHPDDNTSTFEVICHECGDDPDLNYREVSSELRQIRGPYPLTAGTAAFLKHAEDHDTAEETGTRHVRPDLAILDRAAVSYSS
jgi:transposase